MQHGFDPDAPLAGRIEVLENAVVVPWGEGRRKGIARPAGVFHADGRYCRAGQAFRAESRPTTLEPAFPKPAEITGELSGTVLYAGLAYGHFGHALCESTARLWALDHAGPVDEVLFLPKKRLTWPMRSLRQLRPIMEALGPMPPLTAISEPTLVERLIVPPQGFGVGGLIAGCPEFRAFTESRLRQRVVPDGPEKLYISRSRLFRKRGRLLFEDVIEARMAREGYEIFHPQEHDLQTQLARYKAARVIVSTDNSALHLAAFVIAPECRVAILTRRPGHIIDDFLLHLDRFAGVCPTVVETCLRYWFRADEKVQFNEVMTLLDLGRTGAALRQAGFVAHGDWPEPTGAELDAELRAFEARAEASLREVFP
ncbi:Protein of unknown function [Salinihabitans flavidus]|uniref:Glycosyltransferase 61 catalytic domain-containing protein n=1 Tax=Salinihabitans flavidus TaxID=569882 RepID=A0A1H8LSZ5_9RHOB|nr:glycosyltransferase family 61 protein [Salinihabitans flavidus]SEO07966.1 Protein of unknown function [Salinihabitans flavidus]